MSYFPKLPTIKEIPFVVVRPKPIKPQSATLEKTIEKCIICLEILTKTPFSISGEENRKEFICSGACFSKHIINASKQIPVKNE